MIARYFYQLFRLVVVAVFAFLVSPLLADRISFPAWLMFIILLLEGLFLLDLPYNLKEYYSALWLHHRGYGSFTGEGLGVTLFGTLLYVVAPIAVLIWLLSRFLPEIYSSGTITMILERLH